MIKHLKRVGNGNALFLDKAVLELVGLEEGGEVQLTVHDGSILVTPVRPRTASREEVDAALKEVVQERWDVLKKLAE